jgi:nitrogenase molybdenum-iron protein alpha/beta subunit
MVAAIGSGDGWGLLICPSPTASLVGVDYSAVVRSVEARLRMKALVLSPLESVGDWCAGYAQVMELLAERIDLPPRPGGPDPETVAIVGYLWDRNEADHSASVAECVRLLGAIGLRTSSVWFSGCPAASLSAVSEAGTIVALPYGGQAAEILAGRTGASVVRLGLPVGFDGTARWLLELGERTGRSSQAAACVEREAARAYDLAAKAVTRHFLGRDFAICTETVLAGALAGMVRELGGSVRLLAGAGSPAVELPPDAADRVLLDGNMEELRSALRQVVAASQTIPVLVGNERAIALVESPGLAVVPMGFRSGGIHYLHGTPFLGFEGALSLVDRIGNAIALKEMLLG